VCGKYFDLDWGDEPPEKCRMCGTLNWDKGVVTRDATYIRKGISKNKKRLNPGAASRKRQTQGREQYQGFRSKEQVEAAKEKGDN
jgi:hypothetical protein